jgi:hypothetical protein
LEAEIVTLIKDLQKKNMQNNSKVLDEIISNQRPHHDKSRLGYNHTETDSSSKTRDEEIKPIITQRQSEDIMKGKKTRNLKRKIIYIPHLQEDSKFIISSNQK